MPVLYLRYRRQRRGLSQSELARLAQTHQSLLSRVENGFASPDDELLTRLAGILDVQPPFALLRPVTVAATASFADSDEAVNA